MNVNQYFANVETVLQAPAPFTLGTAPELSQVYGPGAQNANLAIYKNFVLSRFREGASLQVRAETINAFNHVQYGAPNTTFGNPEFGVVSNQVNSPRQIQLGMKLYFNPPGAFRAAQFSRRPEGIFALALWFMATGGRGKASLVTATRINRAKV